MRVDTGTLTHIRIDVREQSWERGVQTGVSAPPTPHTPPLLQKRAPPTMATHAALPPEILSNQRQPVAAVQRAIQGMCDIQHGIVD